jgi:hypothetical protein
LAEEIVAVTREFAIKSKRVSADRQDRPGRASPTMARISGLKEDDQIVPRYRAYAPSVDVFDGGSFPSIYGVNSF